MNSKHQLYPRRKVILAEISEAWWDQLSAQRKFYVTAECGHMVVRRGKTAPLWIRCEGCEPL